MKNLLAILYKNHLLLLFLFLEITAVTFAIQHNNFQRASFINSASYITGNTYEVMNNFDSYMDLKEKNKLLADSLAKLKGQTLSAYLKKDTSITKVSDTLYKQRYTYITAEVLHQTIHKVNNFLTLNKGSEDGIEVDMAVLGVNGVVGKVNGVTSNFCSVLSLLNSQSSLSCKFKKNNALGSLVWNGKMQSGLTYRQALLVDVPLTTKVTVGDTVVTSGFSDNFPGGIPVGKVVDFKIEDEGQSQEVRLELFLDFNILDHVFIVRDIFRQEKDSLHIKYQNAN
ncbi:MAG: rod shape-determining protein MreC [Bacteroidetes bacterium]|nr:rod shape-determining protein MreC [Bacteroidota bacterium]